MYVEEEAQSPQYQIHPLYGIVQKNSTERGNGTSMKESMCN